MGSHWVIHAPAFAEEMNKSRHMVARQARRLAANGHTVVVPDLCGTGDSPDSLEVATWQGWVEELCAVVHWARDQGTQSITLWGLRLGCLLALEAAVRLEARAAPPDHLLLWQPLLAGKLQMAQFLRLVTAAAVTRGQEGQTAASVKAALAEGETVEVAGYPLSSILYSGLQDADAAALTLPANTSVTVIEVASQADKPLLPVTAKHLASWQEAGMACTARTVVGDAFWATQELGFADALLNASDEALGAFGAEGPSTQKMDSRRPVSLTIDAERRGVASSVVFRCQSAQLAGRLHVPESFAPKSTGVVIVVGGPQYRVGSHRQFVSLAESLADAGYPVLRFDYRGMGDSDGELAGFTAIHDDIAAGIDALQAAVPVVERVALWGLCDAATAAIAYAGGDPRVVRAALANPWVYSEQGAANVKIKHYYAARIFSLAFWQRLFGGRVALLQSIEDFAKVVVRAIVPRGAHNGTKSDNEDMSWMIDAGDLGGTFLRGLRAFPKPVLLLLSGDDFTAMEFQREVDRNAELRAALEPANIQIHRLADADHTFSRRDWQADVETRTTAFLREA
ncbi:exosortase A-associated hydrolase 1/exosortase A-associated hydrolase 2 [Chromatocurvus halotolerans]|uniref:Exosortase A-associated hydrolase 1/exosortase A-associated hydrolase 2 n=2 Tax=Chromatocurvus halotolerans TaxID=1132028 RepID=A0A4R2KVP2_9GAMM|nr:exosortase A-associated hydrolase 1/exosortase A-associated hydrolase 2 [Chromatocurvus halotolerans]